MRRENGITLIALIITIIILVILAAVSIRAVYEMGIVGHAINGTQTYAGEAVKENQILGETGNTIEDALAKLNEIQNKEEFDITKNKWVLYQDDWSGGSYYTFSAEGAFELINSAQGNVHAGTYIFDGSTLIMTHKDYFGDDYTENYNYNGESFIFVSEEVTKRLEEVKPKTITFKIDNVAYTADNGMTWNEWIDSKYNTQNFTIGGGRIYWNDRELQVQRYGVILEGNYESSEVGGGGLV